MQKPVITLIGTSVRPWQWGEFFGSIRLNHISFEVIFVGVSKISVATPQNFHFIFSKVKPVQCLEIAARAASGKYVMVVADDVTLNPHGIDGIVSWLYRLNKWAVVGCRYDRCREDEPELNRQSSLLPYILNSPVVPICGAMRTESWHALGGLDQGFIATCASQDLYLRAFSRGGTPFISPDTIVYEKPTESSKEAQRLSRRYKRDKLRLCALWLDHSDEGVVTFRESRGEPAVPFLEHDLKLVSQGPKGRWR